MIREAKMIFKLFCTNTSICKKNCGLGIQKLEQISIANQRYAIEQTTTENEKFNIL